jgi:hypothetical protein
LPALAGPLDLGGGPLEAGADLVGLQLNRVQVAVEAAQRLDHRRERQTLLSQIA